jgi:hypothetical protein
MIRSDDPVALVASSPATSEPPALTWTALRNATYPSELPRSKQAPLRDGLYEEEIAPGSATRLRIQLADIAGFGQLDDDSAPDAAVVLISSPGGSGTFIYLVAVNNSGGSPLPRATTLLGDRVAVRGVRIEDRKITVGMRVRGATDPFALLTREGDRTYSLQKVTPGQRWGITAGTESGERANAAVGLKNGWYPADSGWRINSIGFIVSRDAQQYYSIAVLTNDQPSRSYGIDTIEGVAREIRASLLN